MSSHWMQSLVLSVLLGSPALAVGSSTLHSPTFGDVVVYAPSDAPSQVVLFVSGDGGWNQGVIPMAERLRDEGALVVGIDIRRYIRGVAASHAACAYPAGDLEELSRTVQLDYHLPAYRRPILVGYSSGATLVYAAIAAAPSETFSGAMSLGFCPDLDFGKPPCHSRGLRSVARKRAGVDLEPFPELAVPWQVLQGLIDQVCSPSSTRSFTQAIGNARLVELPKVGHGFSVLRNWMPQYLDAYRAIATPQAPPPAPSLAAVADLPLVEVAARNQADGGADLLAVVLSGDGGWADIDQGLAGALASRGIATVGLNSLRYFWQPRTPEQAAADLGRIIEHYLAGWKRRRAILIGYSFGADTLPFMVNRLAAKERSEVASVALLGLSPEASFEFHVTSWLGAGGNPRFPTVPEVRRLRGVDVACVRGRDESDSACVKLTDAAVRQIVMPGGHHFGGDYEAIVERLLEPLLTQPSRPHAPPPAHAVN